MCNLVFMVHLFADLVHVPAARASRPVKACLLEVSIKDLYEAVGVAVVMDAAALVHVPT